MLKLKANPLHNKSCNVLFWLAPASDLQRGSLLQLSYTTHTKHSKLPNAEDPPFKYTVQSLFWQEKPHINYPSSLQNNNNGSYSGIKVNKCHLFRSSRGSSLAASTNDPWPGERGLHEAFRLALVDPYPNEHGTRVGLLQPRWGLTFLAAEEGKGEGDEKKKNNRRNKKEESRRKCKRL